MNKPVKIAIPASPDYDADGYGWAMAQGALIRARRFDDIDWENVAEEIETMGRSEYDTVESALRLVLLHLLKWDHQTAFRSKSRMMSIIVHCRRFERALKRNPGLKSKLEEILVDAYEDARFEAAQETGLAIEVFPAEPPSWDEIRAPLEP